MRVDGEMSMISPNTVLSSSGFSRATPPSVVGHTTISAMIRCFPGALTLSLLSLLPGGAVAAGPLIQDEGASTDFLVSQLAAACRRRTSKGKINGRFLLCRNASHFQQHGNWDCGYRNIQVCASVAACFRARLSRFVPSCR